jgi:hypothetical protein
MKTTQEMSTVDRVSTHEELHQVLALLNDSADRFANEAGPEADEENGLQDAVATLWQDSANAEGENEMDGDDTRWAEFARQTERVN